MQECPILVALAKPRQAAWEWIFEAWHLALEDGIIISLRRRKSREGRPSVGANQEP